MASRHRAGGVARRAPCLRPHYRGAGKSCEGRAEGREGTPSQITWSKRCDSLELGRTNYLTIQNREVLWPLLLKQGLKTGIVDALLREASRHTPLERNTSADLVGRSRKDGRGITFEQLGESTNTTNTCSTRQSWREGRGTATRWRSARPSLSSQYARTDRMSPMKVQDLKRMLTELVLAGESVNSLRIAVSAVAASLQRVGRRTPVHGRSLQRGALRGVDRVRGPVGRLDGMGCWERVGRVGALHAGVNRVTMRGASGAWACCTLSLGTA